MKAAERLGKILGIALVVVLLGLAAGFNGCGGQKPGGEVPGESGRQPARQDKAPAQPEETETPESAGKPPAGMMEVTLYFADSNAEKLVAERRTIRKTPAVAKAIMRELLSGPRQPDLFPTLPRSMRLLGVKMNGRTAVVNLSDVRKRGIGGTAAERMIVYSIVNSLTELRGVKNVQFLLDGRRQDVLLDAFDITRPVERDESLIGR